MSIHKIFGNFKNKGKKKLFPASIEWFLDEIHQMKPCCVKLETQLIVILEALPIPENLKLCHTILCIGWWWKAEPPWREKRWIRWQGLWRAWNIYCHFHLLSVHNRTHLVPIDFKFSIHERNSAIISRMSRYNMHLVC